jgi:hypothetical protein
MRPIFSRTIEDRRVTANRPRGAACSGRLGVFFGDGKRTAKQAEPGERLCQFT